MTTRFLLQSIIYSLAGTTLLVVSHTASAAYTNYYDYTKFSGLSAAERKEAEKVFNVDNIYNIYTKNKPLLTDYYVANPSQYGPYAVPAQEAYDPYSLLRGKNANPDNRRYPVYGTVANCTTPSNPLYHVYDARPVDSTPIYNYVNKPLPKVARPAGVTLYSNFSANPNVVTRW